MQERQAVQTLEHIRWGGNPVSPFDPTSKVYRCGFNRYKCKKSNRYFNVRTGTVFQNSRLPLTLWFDAFQFLSLHPEAKSLHLAQLLNTSNKTAWQLLKKIGKLLPAIQHTKPTGNQKLSITDWFQTINPKS